jgi:hypothetical protein
VIVADMWRFFVRRILPEVDNGGYYQARLSLKADLAWQPYLHPAVFIGSFLTILFGDRDMIPPVDHWDWVWLGGGLVSPIAGFTSIWIMKKKPGRPRYRAFWLRLASNIGVATTMMVYEIARFSTEIRSPIEYHPLVDTVFLASILFMLVLIYRDIKFLLIMERVAAVIYRDVRTLTINERLSEKFWNDNVR